MRSELSGGGAVGLWFGKDGLQTLAAADVVKGKLCTAYPAIKPELILAGAKWGEVNATFSNAFADGTLVTAPAWPGHPEWMRKFLDVPGTKIEP
jgi:protease I